VFVIGTGFRFPVGASSFYKDITKLNYNWAGGLVVRDLSLDQIELSDSPENDAALNARFGRTLANTRQKSQVRPAV